MHDDHWSNVLIYVHVGRRMERVRETETTPEINTQNMAIAERPTSEHLLVQWCDQKEKRARFRTEMANASKSF